MHRFVLEPSHSLKLDNQRKRVKQCPCNKKNWDGKFVPFKDFEDRGYCHSCALWLPVACHPCPQCRKDFAVNLYIDTENSNAYLHKNVGKCLYCSYHYPPKQYFEDNPEQEQHKEKGNESTYIRKKEPIPVQKTEPGKPIEKEPVSFVPAELFKQSLNTYDKNNFVKFLAERFGAALASEAVSKYFIGTANRWPGATIFWQVDNFGNIRTGKIMLYNPVDGKRVKEPQNLIGWVHGSLQQPEFHLKQCHFGLHLLKAELQKPVALCESEKGAVIGSIYFPEFIWIAAGSKDGLTAEKCKALHGRRGVLFPDLNAFDLWTEKQRGYESLSGFTVSDLLQRNATLDEIKAGLDLADYLLNFPVTAFQNSSLDLSTADILHLPTCHSLSSEFERLIIQGTKTKRGSFYDLLFSAEGELVKPEEKDETILKLNKHFEKNFVSAFLDGTPCFIHIYKN